MEFNYSKTRASLVSAEQTPPNSSLIVNQPNKIQSLVEGVSKELNNKLCQLDKLRSQFMEDELNCRAQLVESCQELRNDLEILEAKQKKIQDCLKNFRAF